MSAVVIESFYGERTVEVPKVDRHEIDKDGRLLLFAGYYQPARAVFQPSHWEAFTITPERDRNGRFIKRGDR